MAQEAVVRLLRGRGEREEFKRIAQYCFSDPWGWTDRIFPLDRGDEAWGVFRGRTLESGLITRDYLARLFGTWQRLSGVSIVETPPEFRNNRNISALFARVLKHEYESGKIFSALYPFSFEYYARYGYGPLGGPLFASFAPENLALTRPAAGDFRPFSGSRAALDDYYAVLEEWAAGRSFGIRPRRLNAARFRDNLEWTRDRIVFYYEGKRCGGFVRLHKKNNENALADLDIRKIAWRDGRAFRALMYLVQTHRNQIREVTWYMPANVPLAALLHYPRVSLRRSHDWMARPLDVEAICRLKAKQRPPRTEIVFSVEDELLPENTGTYRIKGDEVRKARFDPVRALPLPVFSSLVFGGLSAADAGLAGKAGAALQDDADGFFSADPTLFLSEHF